MEFERVNAALNLMRRLPPSDMEVNLSALINLIPELTDDLLQRIDQPLQAIKDDTAGRFYLLCDYNRDGDSYRSPWTNNYTPYIEDGFKPPKSLRELEIKANTIFDAYRELYYEGGVSSVYFWDQDAEYSFAGCFLIKKTILEPKRSVNKGSWDSIHIVEVIPVNVKRGVGKYSYKLTTTVMLSMTTRKGCAGDVNLSGSLTRQAKETTLKVDKADDHLVNLGKMIESMEIEMRNQLDSLYIQKTREVVNSIRRPVPVEETPSQAFVADLTGHLAKMVSKD